MSLIRVNGTEAVNSALKDGKDGWIFLITMSSCEIEILITISSSHLKIDTNLQNQVLITVCFCIKCSNSIKQHFKFYLKEIESYEYINGYMWCIDVVAI